MGIVKNRDSERLKAREEEREREHEIDEQVTVIFKSMYFPLIFFPRNPNHICHIAYNTSKLKACILRFKGSFKDWHQGVNQHARHVDVNHYCVNKKKKKKN